MYFCKHNLYYIIYLSSNAKKYIIIWFFLLPHTLKKIDFQFNYHRIFFYQMMPTPCSTHSNVASKKICFVTNLLKRSLHGKKYLLWPLS
jgi:hypothetical protein